APYYKAGEVILTLQGKPTHRVLAKDVEPGRWNVTLYGPRAFVTAAELSMQNNSREVGPDLLEALADSGISLKPYRCPKQSHPASGGRTVYAIGAGTMQPA